MFKRENIRKNLLRVKQIADQKVGRFEKSEVLSDDLQSSEKRVDLVKHVCSNTVKKLGSSLLGSATSDGEKKLKRMPEAALGHSMIESANILGTDGIMGQLFQMSGECQSCLAQKHLQYEIDTERNVIEPLQEILEVEIPQIMRLKKALNKVTLDMDSAKNRWNAAVKQTQVPGVNMASASAKADTVKDEFEEASNRVDQARDALTTGLFNFISREADHSQNLLSLLEAQAMYHRQALDEIEKVIPRMRESLSCNPTKPVYGVSLEEHLRVTNRDIAQVLEACICFLVETGLDEEGLFRIAGMASKVKKLKASFDAGVDFDDNGELDQHTVAGAMKQYLRELPEPLLTFELFQDFVTAVQKPADQRLQAIWCVVDKLPKPNYDNFRYLVKFLSKLTERSDVNKMTPSNIAIVIGPNLMWSEGDSGPNMANTGILSLITELIVQNAEWFFPGDISFGCDSESPIAYKGAPDSGYEQKLLERTGSNQSVSSQGTPHSSPETNHMLASPAAPPQTPPPAVSRSPSVSPGSSQSNLSHEAPLAESEELTPISRRQSRKPAPPPPERPYTVAVSASIRASQIQPHKTWPRQAAPPQMDSSPNPLSQSDKQRTLPPERPHPPERVSSLVAHHGHSDRPKVPPPVVPPGHQRSASAGGPATSAQRPLVTPGGGDIGEPGSQKSLEAQDAHASSTASINNHHNQQQDTLNASSLSRPSKPPRHFPPPPPTPTDVVEKTHL